VAGAVALDLGGDGGAQAETLRDDLGRELVEPVLDRRVEVADRFEQAERNEGGNGFGLRGTVGRQAGSG
jgi:hypothetical protein